MKLDYRYILDLADAAIIPLLNHPHYDPQETQIKEDGTEVTEWDLWVEREVLKVLNTGPYPVLSEETSIDFEDRAHWNSFWVLDPIDGTKGLVEGNGQYCTLLAFIHEGEPVIGYILDYRTNTIYRGGKTIEFAKWVGEKWEGITIKNGPAVFYKSNHFFKPKDLEIFEEIKKKESTLQQAHLGSALKFLECCINKNAHYGRTGTIMEWDVAAGAALCMSVGKKIVSLDGQALKFNKKDLRVRGFRIIEE